VLGADRRPTTLSGMAMLHADDGYSRRGNFDGALVCSTV